MNSKLLLFVVCFSIGSNIIGQEKSIWGNWDWLMGSWIGEGSGEPGAGGGTFSFSLDLDEKILIRKSHSEYPAEDNTPAIIHDDLMIVYPDLNGIPASAIYFDNEGHTISYQITYSDNAIILTSTKIPGVPVFRLTYTLLNSDTVDTKFEISQDGENFILYLEGKSKKIN